MSHFADARLKIERATKHIGDIKGRIGRLEESYTSTIEIDSKPGYQRIKYDLADKTAVKDIAVLIGDALHNLKCALDYSWIGILERHAPVAISGKTQFPIHPSADSLKIALESSKIHLAHLPLFNLMLTSIKPYDGGDNALCAVKKLNILDKHRLLLPLIGYTAIDGLQVENETGEPIIGFAGTTQEPPPWYVQFPNNWNIKNNGKPSIDILFDEGTPTHHLNATAHLEHYSIIILRIVEMLERF
jgi:hypothetical protein